MSRRLTVTPAQLQSLVEALAPLGFTPARIEVAPSGVVIVHGQRSAEDGEPDALAQWEAARAAKIH